jgi:hypothetical protein
LEGLFSPLLLLREREREVALKSRDYVQLLENFVGFEKSPGSVGDWWRWRGRLPQSAVRVSACEF